MHTQDDGTERYLDNEKIILRFLYSVILGVSNISVIDVFVIDELSCNEK